MWLVALTSIISCAISVAAKFLADHFLIRRIAILGDAVGLQMATNPGVAFSIRFPPLLQTALIAAALAGVFVLAHRSATTITRRIGFGLILGGALANIIDRIPDGLVTDFIQVGSFPIFNVADSCITIGAAVLLLEAVLHGRDN